MKSKTYFGEYSLRHWINLMLKRNIILPDYQRSFVWNPMDVERLVHSFKTGQFIQPVTIARMNSIGDGINIILDGQQRLTSILLLAVGYFPKKEQFRDELRFASDDDMEDTDSDFTLTNNILDWTFERMLSEDIEKNSLLQVQNRVSSNDKYEVLRFRNSDYQMTGTDLDEFLDDTFLGFSYIVPENADASTEQKFFSTLFRNMNYLGKKLSTLESRKSLYYLNQQYKDYFEGNLRDGSNALSNLRIMENVAPRRIDFVRYLSILSQYDERGTKARKVMVGYSSYASRESYYVDYVSYILGLDQEDRGDKFNRFSFSTTFGTDGWRDRFARLKDTIEALKVRMNLDIKYPDAFRSWIDADYWLFGLIYWIVFKDKEINLDTDWTSILNNEISGKKEDPDSSYVRSPNMLGHLRERIARSIELIGDHIKR